jgi:hypothetical protein
MAKGILHGSILAGLVTTLEDQEVHDLAKCPTDLKIVPG